MDGPYEVLNPWAEVDPIPLRGISPRIAELPGKTVGLFASIDKRASRPILQAVELRLKERFPATEVRWFEFPLNRDVDATDHRARFEDWIKGVDAVIAAVGD